MKRSVKSVIAVCLACAFAFALCGCSSTEEYTPELGASTIDNSALVTADTLTVGVDASNAPFAAQVDGKIVGIDVDVAAAVADAMGLSLQIVDIGSDASGAITGGTVDIVMGIESTNTSVDAWLSDSYIDTAISLFATDAEADVPTSDTVATIAAQTSSLSASEVVEQFGGDYLTSTEDLQSAFSNLDGGTVMYAASDAVVGSYVVHSSNYSASIIALMQKPYGYSIGVGSSNTDLKTEIATAVANLTDQGIFDVIEKKWLGVNLDLDSVVLTEGATSAIATGSSSDEDDTSDSSDSDSSSTDEDSTLGEVGANAATIE